ncbi:MAG: hypothetical protein IT329_18170 [Caldilineaceae bacterium]|nr:hypothetical protein [Caldilineaceae bacterium]
MKTEQPTLDPLLRAAVDRQLTTPLLLWMTGHRPLAFFAGQALYLAAPMAALLGWRDAEAWAGLLSSPNAMRTLEAALQARAR